MVKVPRSSTLSFQLWDVKQNIRLCGTGNIMETIEFFPKAWPYWHLEIEDTDQLPLYSHPNTESTFDRRFNHLRNHLEQLYSTYRA